jgi:hypothetical protein
MDGVEGIVFSDLGVEIYLLPILPSLSWHLFAQDGV